MRLEGTTTIGAKQPIAGWSRGLGIHLAGETSTDRSQLASDAYQHTSQLQICLRARPGWNRLGP